MNMSAREKVGTFFKEYIIEMVIALACAAYILTGITQIIKTGKTITEIVASGLMAFLFGFTICRLFAQKGLLVGQKDERFVGTLVEFGKEVDKTIPNIDRLSDYCKERNERELRLARTRILAEGGMSYEKYIAGDYRAGNLNKHEKRALIRADRAKIHAFNTYELLSENGGFSAERGFGRSKEEFMKISGLKDILSRGLTAFIFGYFGLSFIGGFDWANLMWSLVQVAFFIVSGTMKYVASFNFITETFRNRIIKKINILEEFNKENEDRKEENNVSGKVQESVQGAAAPVTESERVAGDGGEARG